MNIRHIYLRIEAVPNYSPVAPDDAEHHKHRLDCMRNMEHTDTTIQQAEVDRRSLDALAYREYLDAAHAAVKNTPFIAADINAVVLIAPIAVTHHTDAGQRYIKLPIHSRTATTVETVAPAHGNIAPPGFYMLFVVDNQGIPSEAKFVAIS